MWVGLTPTVSDRPLCARLFVLFGPSVIAMLVRYHQSHFFGDPARAFDVSTPFWDVIFRT